MWNQHVKTKKLSLKHKTTKTYEAVVENDGKPKTDTKKPTKPHKKKEKMIGEDRRWSEMIQKTWRVNGEGKTKKWSEET